jgi:hypothetical protein
MTAAVSKLCNAVPGSRRFLLMAAFGLAILLGGVLPQAKVQAQIVISGQVYGGGTTQPTQVQPGLWLMDSQDDRVSVTGAYANQYRWLLETNQPPKFVVTGRASGGYLYYRQIKGGAITANQNGQYYYLLDLGPEYCMYVGPSSPLLAPNVVFLN